MVWLVLVTAGLAAWFAFRYLSLRAALREADRELREIQRELAENRFLHLPSPEPRLERFIGSVNETLEGIRKERREYARREREFGQQIENISHDLRTPLTVMLGYLKLMRTERGGEENHKRDHEKGDMEEDKEMLAVMERSARTMERLVEQFYSYSRLKSDDYRMELGEVDVCRLVKETLMSCYQVLDGAGLSVECDLPEHPVSVTGEEGSLERVFTNLFQNAGRYASSYLHIRLEEGPDDTTVIFDNDTDQISEEDIPYLFERFYMQDPSRTRGGTGLGLTVARGLVEAMGGKMTVQAAGLPEAKSREICFWVSLKKRRD
ncbi:MAG: HAMP domain-containing histidine kinase [Lachnospiraceae bacterium]|jgi:signal transduction histidine kinase|nr:HAMP domain-containing histidine kinase [Lachnospiraceae bacterium]